MRKISILTPLLILFLNPIAWSQSQGVVYYDEIINIHANLSADQQAFKSVIPEFQTQKKELYFNGKLTKLKNGEKAGSTGGVQIFIGNSASETIFDYEKTETIQLAEIQGKKFLVRESMITDKNVEYIDGTKEILGYICKKALLQGTTINGNGEETHFTYTVWYTDTDGLKGSPIPTINVPGLVLSMESDLFEFKATAMKLQPVASSIFEIPENYKEISSGQLADLREEVIEELQGQ